ncbi:unnamed protein product [Moneuplotes crassus]|uniref:Uncharacterized protein n=1 Tax=Euplotes crassus TaxID=5936 RepID=A0AAD1Y6L2_EUPCR|nr:unnamed protein product [Moneuplotes crassus]
MDLKLENASQSCNTNRLTFGSPQISQDLTLKQRISKQINKNKKCFKTLKANFDKVSSEISKLKCIRQRQKGGASSLQEKLEAFHNNFENLIQKDLCQYTSGNHDLIKQVQALADEFCRDLLEMFMIQENEYINQLELFKLEQDIKIDEKLAAYSSMSVKIEESMQMVNSQSSIKNMINKMSSLQGRIRGGVDKLKSLHSQRENIEVQVIDELQENNIPISDLSDKGDNGGYDTKELAFNTTQAVDVKTAIKEFKTHRSLEESELENITSSLSCYDKVHEDIEFEIHQLQKKTLVLQQEINNRDEIISKLESANRILTYSNANKLNSSVISAIPLTTRPTDQNTIRKIANHIRKKNLSLEMSETKNISFRTPETKGRNVKESNGAHTAEILKHPQLEIQSDDSSVQPNEKVIDLSDILQTPDDDNSGFQNLLEDEILSSDLASFSQNEVNNIQVLDDEKQEDNEESDEESNEEGNKQGNEEGNEEYIEDNHEENHEESFEESCEGTHNSRERSPSMPDPAIELKCYEELINLESKYLNMSLGDIPEEYEENATLSEKNSSSLDKYENTASNLSSKCVSDSNNTCQNIPIIENLCNKGSIDTHHSPYMTSDKIHSNFLNETTKFQQDSLSQMKRFPDKIQREENPKDKSPATPVSHLSNPSMPTKEMHPNPSFSHPLVPSDLCCSSHCTSLALPTEADCHPDVDWNRELGD